MSSELVTVARFLSPEEAHLLRGELEEQGIPAYVEDDATASMAWIYRGAIQGVHLTVPESHAKDASAIVAEARSRFSPDRRDVGIGSKRQCSQGHFVEHDAETCSVCGEPLLPEDVLEGIQANDDRIDRAWRAAVIGLVFLPLILHLLSVGLLIQVARSPYDSSTNRAAKWWGAFCISGAVLLLAFWLSGYIVSFFLGDDWTNYWLMWRINARAKGLYN